MLLQHHQQVHSAAAQQPKQQQQRRTWVSSSNVKQQEQQARDARRHAAGDSASHWHIITAAARRVGVVSRASSADSLSSGGEWSAHGFPSYLQNQVAKPFPCQDEKANDGRWKRENALWQQIRRQAQVDAGAEPLLSSFMYASVLAHDSFEKALAFVLANRLANTTLLPTQLFEIFVEILQQDDDTRCAALADVEAVYERDPACQSLLQPLLYSKGYHAIQTHRIAHALWMRGQRVMALALQSRSSEVFAVDIHPAARIGKGVLLDHGTGVVIGETATIGDNCSLLQNVTLGGTGKETGDRHPKIGDNVLIGANATVLGNINIGRGAQIAAGSLVLKPVAPCTMVAGSPAKEVGTVQGNPAKTMSHWNQGECIPCGGASTPANASQATALPGATSHRPIAAAPFGSNGNGNGSHHAPSQAQAPGPQPASPQLPVPQVPDGSASRAAANVAPSTAAAVASKNGAGASRSTKQPPQHWPLSGLAANTNTDPLQPGEGI